jgi:hypothetical protein
MEFPPAYDRIVACGYFSRIAGMRRRYKYGAEMQSSSAAGPVPIQVAGNLEISYAATVAVNRSTGGRRSAGIPLPTSFHPNMVCMKEISGIGHGD